MIIHYLWFYFIGKRKTKTAQSFVSAPSFILEIQLEHIKHFTFKWKALLEFMDHLSCQRQKHCTFCQRFNAAASTVICYRPSTLAKATHMRGLWVSTQAVLLFQETWPKTWSENAEFIFCFQRIAKPINLLFDCHETFNFNFQTFYALRSKAF